MKRSFALAITILLATCLSFATPVNHFGGIVGEESLKAKVYFYSELLLITGEAIELTGTVTTPVVPTGRSSYTLAYKYDLRNLEKDVVLTRTVTYNVAATSHEKLGQKVFTYTINSGGLKEEVTVGGDTYTLGSFVFSDSIVEDNRPAVNFNSGNLHYKKVFFKNGDTKDDNDGIITIEADSDRMVGYQHFWGYTQTNVLNVSVDAVLKGTDTGTDTTAVKPIRWTAYVTLRSSQTDAKRFEYVSNDLKNISFRGGFLQVGDRNHILQYTYDLPYFSEEGILDHSKRSRGESTMRQDIFVDSKRLVVPKFRDIAGHWAEEAAFLLSSLDAFNTGSYFYPNLQVSREEFAKAITNSIAYVAPETAAQIKAETIKLSRPTSVGLAFTDTPRDSPYYVYIDYVKKNGIMVGQGNGQFLPTKALTRAEAIKILVNTLGLENVAPSPPYSTGFTDDYMIPQWAKDAIYIGSEVGLIAGYDDGTIRPYQVMTKAESAQLLYRFIHYLKDEITTDYREKMMNAF
jgi:hypothetical protein